MTNNVRRRKTKNERIIFDARRDNKGEGIKLGDLIKILQKIDKNSISS